MGAKIHLNCTSQEGTERQTNGHRDSMTELAQWADSVKICKDVRINGGQELPFPSKDVICPAMLSPALKLAYQACTIKVSDGTAIEAFSMSSHVLLI